jgi:hypothetical protein
MPMKLQITVPKTCAMFPKLSSRSTAELWNRIKFLERFDDGLILLYDIACLQMTINSLKPNERTVNIVNRIVKPIMTMLKW